MSFDIAIAVMEEHLLEFESRLPLLQFAKMVIFQRLYLDIFLVRLFAERIFILELCNRKTGFLLEHADAVQQPPQTSAASASASSGGVDDDENKKNKGRVEGKEEEEQEQEQEQEEEEEEQEEKEEQRENQEEGEEEQEEGKYGQESTMNEKELVEKREEVKEEKEQREEEELEQKWRQRRKQKQTQELRKQQEIKEEHRKDRAQERENKKQKKREEEQQRNMEAKEEEECRQRHEQRCHMQEEQYQDEEELQMIENMQKEQCKQHQDGMEQGDKEAQHRQNRKWMEKRGAEQEEEWMGKEGRERGGEEDMESYSRCGRSYIRFAHPMLSPGQVFSGEQCTCKETCAMNAWGKLGYLDLKACKISRISHQEDVQFSKSVPQIAPSSKQSENESTTAKLKMYLSNSLEITKLSTDLETRRSRGKPSFESPADESTEKLGSEKDPDASVPFFLRNEHSRSYSSRVASLHQRSPQEYVVLPIFGPRDMTSEGARLETFLRFSRTSGPSAVRLANAGFFYTGSGDSLECYSCGVTFTCMEEHEQVDPYLVHRLLSPSCPHVNGQDARNVFVQDGQRQVQSALDITGQRQVQSALDITGQGSGQPPPGSTEVRQIVQAAREDLRTVRDLLARVGIIIEPLDAGNGGQRTPDSLSNSSGYVLPARGREAVANGHLPNENAALVPLGSTTHGSSSSSSSSSSVLPNDLSPRVHEGEVPLEAASHTAADSLVGRDVSGLLALGSLQDPAASADFDPERAAYRNYADRARRLASFGGWPDTHAQSPEDLVLCGFFFTGVGDCVRCYFCGLGLKHWDPDDRPLEEHVRWRSSCSFLRALVGDVVIARILAALGRRLRNDSGAEANPGHGAAVSSPSPVPGQQAAVDPQGSGEAAVASTGTARPVDTSSAESWMTSAPVRNARDMGFSDDIIRQAVTALLATRAGARAVTSQNVVHAILYIRERGQEERENEDDWDSDSDDESPQPQVTHVTSTSDPRGGAPNSDVSPPPGESPAWGSSREQTSGRTAANAPPPTGSTTASGATARRTAEELERENQELRERRRCKICLDSDISILFLPCGHLVCCGECAAALLRCPICRTRIRGRVRTQLAPIPPPDRRNSQDDTTTDGGNSGSHKNRGSTQSDGANGRIQRSF